MTKDQVRRLNAISYEIKDWTGKNFKVHAPKIGMLEEVGELAHCFLKRAQKIRGFDDFEHFVNKTKDALGDIAVYTLHDLRMQDYQIVTVDDVDPPIRQMDDIDDVQDILGELATYVGDNLEGTMVGAHECIFSTLDEIAQMFNTDILRVLEEVWGRVKKRNWADNPKDADEK